MSYTFSFDISTIKEDDTFEESLIKEYCYLYPNKYQYEYCKFPLSGSIPIGSVEWCEKIYGSIIPEYYPHYLHSYIKRKIWKTTNVEKYENIFIKPADSYKGFNGHIKNIQDNRLNGKEIWCSEIVHFQNEWRYYILNGKVITAAWYEGSISDEDYLNGQYKPPVELPENLLDLLERNNYTGIMDIGELDDSQLEIVECCHPYAFGMYDYKITPKEFGEFIIGCHEYITTNFTGEK